MLRTGQSWNVSLEVDVLTEEALGWHVSWGDGGFGSGFSCPLQFAECCLLSNGCWVVLLSSLMKLQALGARMGNCVFKVGYGECVSLLGKIVMLPVALGAASVPPWEFLKMQLTQT